MPIDDSITSQSTESERKAKAAAYCKAYYEANREKLLTYSKLWYQKNKDRVQAWEEANKDKRKAQRKLRRDANKEHDRAKRKIHTEANKERIRARRKVYLDANRDLKNAKERAIYYKKRYQLSPEQLDCMIRKSGNKCQCCKLPFSSLLNERPNVDHCHRTGAVRGILCRRCNYALGHAGDNPKILRALARYLERNSGMRQSSGSHED